MAVTRHRRDVKDVVPQKRDQTSVQFHGTGRELVGSEGSRLCFFIVASYTWQKFHYVTIFKNVIWWHVVHHNVAQLYLVTGHLHYPEGNSAPI